LSTALLNTEHAVKKTPQEKLVLFLKNSIAKKYILIIIYITGDHDPQIQAEILAADAALSKTMVPPYFFIK
jgi:hypothetical protein